MAETYTYTARSAEDPERVVTFTLRGSRMSVGVGAPLEQVERAIELGRGERQAEEQVGEEGEGEGEAEIEVSEMAQPKLWLRPLAVSLVERGTGPVHVDDVIAKLTDDWLEVKAWIRTGGLRLVPISLMDGRIDNPVAAQDFVEEIESRRTSTGLKLFALLDYWATWMVAAVAALVVFQRWRRKSSEKGQE